MSASADVRGRLRMRCVPGLARKPERIAPRPSQAVLIARGAAAKSVLVPYADELRITVLNPESDAMKQKGGDWSYDDLNAFLTNPKGFVPGTRMTFVGLKKDDERANVIAFLRGQADSPKPLP